MKRKEPVAEDDHRYAYNEIKVIGLSPIQEVGRSTEWQGQKGSWVSISPETSFDKVIDRPFGELQRDYEVVSIPEPPAQPTPHRKGPPPAANGPTPEDAFRAIESDFNGN